MKGTTKYRYNLYLENEEDEQYVHLDKLQRTIVKERIPKTRITTNPNAKSDLKKKKPLPSVARQGPVRMGVGTLKRKQIVCVSMQRKDVLALAIVLRKTDDGVFVDSMEKVINSKLITGDKIVAVNGRSLEGCSLEKANYILTSSGHLVNLILKR